MKKILVIIAVLIVVIGAVAGVYFFKGGKIPGMNKEETNSLSSGAPMSPQEGNPAEEEFSFYIPEGWRRTAAPQGVSAMVVNADEEITDPAVKRINFRTYFAVSYDSLQGKRMEEYIQILKNGLIKTIGKIDFGEERTMTVNEKEARAIDADIIQQGVAFKVLIVAIRGNGEDVWSLSFNTAKGNWDKYQDLFAEITNSFQVK